MSTWPLSKAARERRNASRRSLHTGLYVSTPKYDLGDPKEGPRPLVGNAKVKCAHCGTSLTAFDCRLHFCAPSSPPTVSTLGAVLRIRGQRIGRL